MAEQGILQEIKELMHREPFVPFRIVLTSGQGYEVANPDLIAIGETIIYVVRPRSDRHDILRQNQITAVEVLEAAT
jgi:hypothetical protein